MKIGIDIGGSHIGIGLVNEQGKIVQKQETDLKQKDASHLQKFIEEYITKQIASMMGQATIEILGVASPGVPKDGSITTMVNLGIPQLDITKIIQKQYTGKIQIRNDAKCAALAEKTYGSLKPYQDAVFLCLGTGIGSSVFIEGKQLEPIRNPGFEIGHMIIKKDGKLCNCRKKGCFETYCSIKRLKDNLIKAMNLSKEISAQELLSILKQRSQEEKVQAILEQYIQNLVVGFSNIIDIFEPQVICLGGSFVHFEEILYHNLQKTYKQRKYMLNKQNLPELKLALLGNDAGIIGATI